MVTEFSSLCLLKKLNEELRLKSTSQQRSVVVLCLSTGVGGRGRGRAAAGNRFSSQGMG